MKFLHGFLFQKPAFYSQKETLKEINLKEINFFFNTQQLKTEKLNYFF